MAGRTPNSRHLARALLDWFSANARDLPWRRTRDPYATWVSEVMLQQTQVNTVIPYWKRWMCELPTVEAAANASPDKIHKLWEGLGYYSRARNLQKAAKEIVARHDACSKARTRRGNESQTENKLETPHVVSYKFPENFDDVLALPGIGRYTAGAICSIAFNQPAPILDGNVVRVLTRIFGIGENPRDKKTNARLWRLAEGLVAHAQQIACQRPRSQSRTSRLRYASPRRGARTKERRGDDWACSRFNQSLMELGALVCTPRQPKCPDCPVKELCVAFRENRVNKLPNLAKRSPATPRHFIALVAERDGHFLVRQRPAGVVNAHLWEFPNAEVAAGIPPAVEPGVPPGGTPPSTAGGTPAATRLASAANDLGFDIRAAEPLCIVKHSITRYRITLEAFHARFGGASFTSPPPTRAKPGTRGARPSETGIWRTPAQMRRLAFTAAHRKILRALAATKRPHRAVRSYAFRRPA